MTRAKGAFVREGWTDVNVAGDEGRSVSADNGELAAVILCLHHTVIVVVSGTDALAPNAARGSNII